VRAAAASSLARIGRAARPAAATLAASLDPFMGVAAEAGAALIAIGPPALPAVEARLAASTVPAGKAGLERRRPVAARGPGSADAGAAT
jgi:hypothetical protein